MAVGIAKASRQYEPLVIETQAAGIDGGELSKRLRTKGTAILWTAQPWTSAAVDARGLTHLLLPLKHLENHLRYFDFL
jgi:hypothetical protein